MHWNWGRKEDKVGECEPNSGCASTVIFVEICL